MLSKVSLKHKCGYCSLEKWNSGIIQKIIGKKSLLIIMNWIDMINPIFNFQDYIYCRKQIRFNGGFWWIMHLHHIGLPPATNYYPIKQVSGNFLN